MQWQLSRIAIAFSMVLALSSHALAQVSFGEFSRLMICPFECKPGTLGTEGAIWDEVTTLMLFNIDNSQSEVALVFLDGNQTAIAEVMGGFLAGFDLDEINVCRTLKAGGVPVPEAGMVMVVADLAGSENGVLYGWAKTYLGKFLMSRNEPFDGAVKGVAKTECRLVPESILQNGVSQILQKADADAAPRIDPVLVEKTDP